MQITSFIVAAALTVISASAGNHNARSPKMHKRVVNSVIEKRASSGNNSPSTWYNVETGNEVACGGHKKNSDWLIAVNSPDFRGGAICGQTVTIKWQGKTQHAVVADECPTCAPHGIDLSRDLFQSFTGLGVGQIYVDWFLGGSEPEPEPKPTPTKQDPPPPPKTTSHKTTSTPSPEPTPSSSSSKKAEKSSTSSSAQPSQSVTVPTGSNNVANLLAVVAQLGSVVVAGASA